MDEFKTATRAEPGALSFDWYRSADDANEWVLIETFRDSEAGKAHVEFGASRQRTPACPACSRMPPRSSILRSRVINGQRWQSLDRLRDPHLVAAM